MRLGAVVTRIDVAGAAGVTVGLAGGEQVRAEAVVCALPAGPLRAVEIGGLSDARLASLRAQRHALAAKVVVAYADPFWQGSGQNGLAEAEWLFGSTWPQRSGVLSLPVPPERLSAFLAAPAAARRAAVLDGLAALYGEQARDPHQLLERHWGVDPFTLGYIAAWAPGDLMRVGPLHGRTSRRSTSPAPITGWPATWRAPCARDGAAAQAALEAGRSSSSGCGWATVAPPGPLAFRRPPGWRPAHPADSLRGRGSGQALMSAQGDVRLMLAR